jgi:homoserine kinase type II
MAVYTPVTVGQAQSLCDDLGLGQALALEPILGGIENTNYFLTTQLPQAAPQKRVLTLFERLDAHQLPYYLNLMAHLGAAQLPVPSPVANPHQPNALRRYVLTVAGKPACVVDCLLGKSELAPSAAHCAQVGTHLAHMHLAAASYTASQPNLRGLAWWNDTAPTLYKHLPPEQLGLLQHELAFQNHIAASPNFAALPQGPVHADLFRDNVMFSASATAEPKLSGVFDFYFAGNDTWLFDLCVTLNDWAIDHKTGAFQPPHLAALLAAYQAVRPLTRAERVLFCPILRGAALRFWISRLWDWHRPRDAQLLKPHDPTHFERVLTQRCAMGFNPLH